MSIEFQEHPPSSTDSGTRLRSLLAEEDLDLGHVPPQRDLRTNPSAESFLSLCSLTVDGTEPGAPDSTAKREPAGNDQVRVTHPNGVRYLEKQEAGNTIRVFENPPEFKDLKLTVKDGKITAAAQIVTNERGEKREILLTAEHGITIDTATGRLVKQEGGRKLLYDSTMSLVQVEGTGGTLIKQGSGADDALSLRSDRSTGNIIAQLKSGETLVIQPDGSKIKYKDEQSTDGSGNIKRTFVEHSSYSNLEMVLKTDGTIVSVTSDKLRIGPADQQIFGQPGNKFLLEQQGNFTLIRDANLTVLAAVRDHKLVARLNAGEPGKETVSITTDSNNNLVASLTNGEKRVTTADGISMQYRETRETDKLIRTFSYPPGCKMEFDATGNTLKSLTRIGPDGQAQTLTVTGDRKVTIDGKTYDVNPVTGSLTCVEGDNKEILKLNGSSEKWTKKPGTSEFYLSSETALFTERTAEGAPPRVFSFTINRNQWGDVISTTCPKREAGRVVLTPDGKPTMLTRAYEYFPGTGGQPARNADGTPQLRQIVAKIDRQIVYTILRPGADSRAWTETRPGAEPVTHNQADFRAQRDGSLIVLNHSRGNFKFGPNGIEIALDPQGRLLPDARQVQEAQQRTSVWRHTHPLSRQAHHGFTPSYMNQPGFAGAPERPGNFSNVRVLGDQGYHMVVSQQVNPQGVVLKRETKFGATDREVPNGVVMHYRKGNGSIETITGVTKIESERLADGNYRTRLFVKGETNPLERFTTADGKLIEGGTIVDTIPPPRQNPAELAYQQVINNLYGALATALPPDTASHSRWLEAASNLATQTQDARIALLQALEQQEQTRQAREALQRQRQALEEQRRLNTPQGRAQFMRHMLQEGLHYALSSTLDSRQQTYNAPETITALDLVVTQGLQRERNLLTVAAQAYPEGSPEKAAAQQRLQQLRGLLEGPQALALRRQQYIDPAINALQQRRGIPVQPRQPVPPRPQVLPRHEVPPQGRVLPPGRG